MRGGAGTEGCEVSNGKKSSSKLQRRWRWRQELGCGRQREDAGGGGGEDGKMKAVGVNPAPIKADSITL